MPTSPTAYQSDEPRFAEQFPILRVLGQFHNAFIIAEGADGLYLIDQHAAHERILFEKACRMQASADFEIQGLLEPVTIAVTAHQQALLESNPEALSEAGFSLEPFGNQSYLLRAVPAMLKQPDISGVLNDILDSLVDGQQSDWQQRIAASLACHGSVRAGQTLSHQEMEELVNQLEATNSPRTCPHGRPTMIQISAMQLEKEFGR